MAEMRQQDAPPQEGDTATNPRTGERVVFSGGRWVPAGGRQAPRVGAPITGPRTPPPQTPDQSALTQAQLQNAQANPSQERFRQASTLRDDYNRQPVVMLYNQSVPVYAASLRTDDSGAGDINLIYGFAKVMDPGSVVRESETANVAGGDTWFNRTVQQMSRQLENNGGQFTPEYRQQLRQQMRIRVQELAAAAQQERERYSAIATRNGINPEDVVGNTADRVFRQADEAYWGPDNQGEPSRQTADMGAGLATRGGVVSGQSGDQRVLANQDFEEYTRPEDIAYGNAFRATIQDGVRRRLSRDEIRANLQAVAQRFSSPAAQYTVGDEVMPLIDNALKGQMTPIANPRTGRRQRGAIDQIIGGAVQNPFGAAVGGAFNAATMGTADEIGANVRSLLEEGRFATDSELADANDRKQMLRRDYPWSYGGGEFAGMVGTSLLPGGAVTRVLTSGAYGAGENNDNRVLGGAVGLGLGGVGEAALPAARRFFGTPSAEMRALVDEGLEPTIGQTMQSAGTPAGRVIKRGEDFVASLPGVGAPAREAQRRAEQSINMVQTNRALRPIGEALPEGAEPGFSAIDAAHRRLSQEYERLLPRISGRADDVIIARLEKIRRDAKIPAGSSGDSALQQANGELERAFEGGLRPGAPFQGRSIADVRQRLGDLASEWKGAQGDPYLREAGRTVDRLKNQLTALVERTNPGLGRRLRDTDRGYATLVQAERAAEAASNNGGVFTANQLNNAVRMTDSSARRNRIARGLGLNQDLSSVAAMTMRNTAAQGGSKDVNAMGALGLGAAGLFSGNPMAYAGAGALGLNSIAYTRGGQNTLRNIALGKSRIPAAAVRGLPLQNDRVANWIDPEEEPYTPPARFQRRF